MTLGIWPVGPARCEPIPKPWPVISLTTGIWSTMQLKLKGLRDPRHPPVGFQWLSRSKASLLMTFVLICLVVGPRWTAKANQRIYDIIIFSFSANCWSTHHGSHQRLRYWTMNPQPQQQGSAEPRCCWYLPASSTMHPPQRCQGGMPGCGKHSKARK